MLVSKNQLFSELLSNFLKFNESIEAVIVSDQEGLMLAGEKREEINMEIISFLTAVVNPIIERIRKEFTFKQYGTASFDTEEHRLLFISIDENLTLSLVIQFMSNIEEIAPYSYFLAEKVAQILTLKEDESVQLSFPNFENDTLFSEESHRLKNHIHQDTLDKRANFSFKFVIMGDHDVGKTSIVRRFVEKKFISDYRVTIGLNILSYEFEDFRNKIKLSLWDIGAQRYFKRYRKTYYNGAQAAFIVFDLTNPKSFENIKYWFNELKEFIETKDLPIIIIGNKYDLVEQRLINFQDGVKLASDLSEVDTFSKSSNLSEFSDLSSLTEKVKTKILYIETSALTGENVENAFNLLSYNFIKKYIEIEETRLQNKIFKDVNSILKNFDQLTLTFITEDPLWNPGLQLLTEIKELGKISQIKENNKEREYKFSNGLILKSYTFDSFKISGSDGVYCIFDAREKDHISPEWKKKTISIIEKLTKNKVLILGIRVSENSDWSQIIEEFDLDDIAEAKKISLLFFKIRTGDHLEICKQIEILLDTIKNFLYSY